MKNNDKIIGREPKKMAPEERAVNQWNHFVTKPAPEMAPLPNFDKKKHQSALCKPRSHNNVQRNESIHITDDNDVQWNRFRHWRNAVKASAAIFDGNPPPNPIEPDRTRSNPIEPDRTAFKSSVAVPGESRPLRLFPASYISNETINIRQSNPIVTLVN